MRQYERYQSELSARTNLKDIILYVSLCTDMELVSNIFCFWFGVWSTRPSEGESVVVFRINMNSLYCLVS